MTEEKSLLNELRSIHIAMRRGMSAIPFTVVRGGLSPVSAMLVHYVYMAGGSALQKDVENEFEMRRSTVSQHLHRLEEEGYIRRRDADGRSKRILLTEKAQSEQSEISRRFEELERYIEGALTPEEKETFCALAEKIRVRIAEIR